MKKNILIITTGGTIAMQKNQNNVVLPTNNLIKLIHSFPQINEKAKIRTIEYSNIPSPHMTPEKIFKLAKLVDKKIENFDGIVITHGTDTLEESAYLLHLTLRTRKPVVFTAAMRSGSDLGLDGPRNIVGAVRVACNPLSIDKGVLVVMNDDIHSARDVVKSDTGKVNSFTSLEYGILGKIDPDQVIFYRSSLIKDNIWTDKIESNIDLIKAVSGMDGRFIEASIENKAKAIVIEAFGRGNLPPQTLPAIKKAISKNILVVVASRAYSGRVLPEYGYKGGGYDLKRLGVIFGNDLRGTKARVVLMLLFGKYDNKEKVIAEFQ